jgi:type III secretion protein U
VSEKKLPPSEQRLREARERGEMPVSRDLVGAVKLCIIVELAFSGEQWTRDLLRQCIDTAISAASQPRPLGPHALGDVLVQAFALMVGLAVLAAALATLATLAQTRLNVAVRAFEAGPKKLNFGANLQQLFSTKKLMMLGMGLLKVGAVLAVCQLTMREQLPDLVRMYYLTPAQAYDLSVRMLLALVRGCAAVLLAAAALDYVVQRITTMRGLRMDISEVRREHKDNEGDPHIKNERRSLARGMINATAKKSTPQPNAVVTNPEHIAIGLYFDDTLRELPVLTSKDHGEKALQMREWAAREGVPVIRFVALARLLLAVGRAGEMVPSQSVRAVAAVGAALQELKLSTWEPGEEFELDPALAETLLPQAAVELPAQRKPLPWQSQAP